jgi:ABC-2 type transport system permease protein
MHLLRAELLKVRSTRLWIGLALGAVGFTALVAVLLLSVAGTSQGTAAGLRVITTTDDMRSFIFVTQGSLPFVLVLAATMATSEFRYGTATLTYLATPSRATVFGGKAAAAAVVGCVFGVAAAAVGLIVAVGWLAAKGSHVPFDASVAGALGQIGLHAAYGALLAVAFGALVRSQVVSILGLLGWIFILEPLLVGIVPRLAKWAPFSGVQPLFGATGDTTAALFGWVGALVLACAYVAVFAIAAVAVERRRDV